MVTDDSYARSMIIFFAGLLATILVSTFILKLGRMWNELSITRTQTLPEPKKLHDGESEKMGIEQGKPLAKIAPKKPLSSGRDCGTSRLRVGTCRGWIIHSGNALMQSKRN